MGDVQIIWDLEDEPHGNVQHLAEHGVTQEEFEEVLVNHHHEATTSRSSGETITFGSTSTGKYLAIVYEEVEADPLTVRPLTAYPTNPPRQKRRKHHGR
jgi:hypothetical protein